jgi:hypothetical protein
MHSAIVGDFSAKTGTLNDFIIQAYARICDVYIKFFTKI